MEALAGRRVRQAYLYATAKSPITRNDANPFRALVCPKEAAIVERMRSPTGYVRSARSNR